MSKKFLYLFEVELLLDVLLLVPSFQLGLLQLEVFWKVDIGMGGKGGDGFLCDDTILDVDSDIIEGFLTAEEGLVNDPSGTILAPSHRILSKH